MKREREYERMKIVLEDIYLISIEHPPASARALFILLFALSFVFLLRQKTHSYTKNAKRCRCVRPEKRQHQRVWCRCKIWRYFRQFEEGKMRFSVLSSVVVDNNNNNVLREERTPSSFLPKPPTKK